MHHTLATAPSDILRSPRDNYNERLRAASEDAHGKVSYDVNLSCFVESAVAIDQLEVDVG
jgi:hypothetical protein